MPDRKSTFAVNRIEAFSDGVLAIIITLLILEIRPPVLHAPDSAGEAIRALIALGPKAAGFLLSFFFIAVFWVNHHRFFVLIRRCDWGMLWLNNLLLLFLCTIPFPTAFLGDHPRNPVAVALFALLLMLAGIAFNLMWRHARQRRLMEETLSGDLLDRAILRGLVGPSAYALAAVAASLTILISWAIFIFVPVFYSWLSRAPAKTDIEKKETNP